MLDLHAEHTFASCELGGPAAQHQQENGGPFPLAQHFTGQVPVDIRLASIYHAGHVLASTFAGGFCSRCSSRLHFLPKQLSGQVYLQKAEG